MEADHRDRVFELAAELFGLLSAPVRLRIVCELCKTELHVSVLRARLGVSQSNLSQHLATLYRCGVVARRREGPRVLYRIDDARAPLLCLAVSDAQWPTGAHLRDRAQDITQDRSPEGAAHGA